MLVLNLINQVILEGFYDEVFIVHEEDILGNWNRLVAVVDGRRGVKEFHPLTVALVLGWWVFDKGVLEQSVKRTSSNDLLCIVANAGDGLEDVLDGVPFHG